MHMSGVHTSYTQNFAPRYSPPFYLLVASDVLKVPGSSSGVHKNCVPLVLASRATEKIWGAQGKYKRWGLTKWIVWGGSACGSRSKELSMNFSNILLYSKPGREGFVPEISQTLSCSNDRNGGIHGVDGGITFFRRRWEKGLNFALHHTIQGMIWKQI